MAMKKYQQYVNDDGSIYSQWFSSIGMAAGNNFDRLLPIIKAKNIDMKTRGREKKTGLFYAIQKTPKHSMMNASALVISVMKRIINELLKNGADPNAICSTELSYNGNMVENVTPIWIAAILNKCELLQLLLDNGGDPNVGNFNPLEVLKNSAFLITDPFKLPSGNDTMIYYAQEVIETIKILIKHNIKIPPTFFTRFKESIDKWYGKNYGEPDKVNKYKKILEDFVEWLIKNNIEVPSNVKQIYTNKNASKFDL